MGRAQRSHGKVITRHRMSRAPGNKPRRPPITSLKAQLRAQGDAAMSCHDHHDEGTKENTGVSRRRVLECMTWAGTGVLWTVTGGVPHSLGMVGSAEAAEAKGMTFL